MNWGLFLLFFVVLVNSYTLPDVCLCNKGAAPELQSCSIRTGLEAAFLPCASSITFKSPVRLASGEGNLTCLCLLSFPAFDDLGGFMQSLVSSASYAVLYAKFDPSHYVDAYVALEYLYGENAELLPVYQSKSGLFASTLRRSTVAAGSQVFWFGFDARAELFWKE